MRYNKLGETDMTVSTYSLGGSAFGNVYNDDIAEENMFAVVRKAFECGVNLIDTAPWYGQGRSEMFLGKILPTFDRSSYFLNTKVGRYESEPAKMFDFSPKRVFESVEKSLSLLNVDYVDVLQVHDVEFAPDLKKIANETLPALQKLKEQGKARYIGVTGYPIDVLKTLIELSPVKIDTALSYCQGSLLNNSLQDHIDFFESHGVGLINASGVCMGLLTNRGPQDWHPANQSIREACRKAAEYCRERGSDIAKLATHFCVTQPRVATTLFSTAKTSELESSLAIVEQGLTEDEEKLSGEVVERFFDPLESHSWHGVELNRYWNEMKKSQS